MNARFAACIVALIAAVAGCATGPRDDEAAPAVEAKPLPPVVIPPAVTGRALPVETVREPEAVQRALAGFERARRLSPPELAREVEAARAAYGRTGADDERVRLALLLALPNTPQNDEARALELLDPLVRATGHPLQPLAVLLATLVQEQRRLEQQTAALQRESHALQQKLDALRSLERSLSEREGAPPRRR